MTIQEYLDEKKNFYEFIILFLDDLEEESEESLFQNVIDEINKQEIQTKHEELDHFLQLLSKIGSNHNRCPRFLNKIEKILIYLKNEIKQTYSNTELFNIFTENKLILLSLIKQNIITLDESVYKEQLFQKNFCHFFLPEIKLLNISEERIHSIESELLNSNANIFDEFEEKRQKGMNDSYICTLIQNDSVEEFISFVNRTNLSLSSQINDSIFETNAFLIKRKPTLIEYAAFYGSIQIFQFLRLNNVELNKSLWLYVVHSNNAELIHLLEDDKVKIPCNSYESVFEESIKCHHNDFANYIESNLLTFNNPKSKLNFKVKMIEMCFQYSNYSIIPNDINDPNLFFYLYQYKYYEIVNDFIERKKNEMKNERFKYISNKLLVFINKIPLNKILNDIQIKKIKMKFHYYLFF